MPKKYRPWTPQEYETSTALRESGASFKTIAAMLRRTVKTVRTRASLLKSSIRQTVRRP
jgi:DNA-binding NarL/FixJ family response regulator